MKSSIFQPLFFSFFIVVCHCPHARMKKCIHPLFVCTWTLCLLQCFYRTNKMGAQTYSDTVYFLENNKMKSFIFMQKILPDTAMASKEKRGNCSKQICMQHVYKIPFSDQMLIDARPILADNNCCNPLFLSHTLRFCRASHLSDVVLDLDIFSPYSLPFAFG